MLQTKELIFLKTGFFFFFFEVIELSTAISLHVQINARSHCIKFIKTKKKEADESTLKIVSLYKEDGRGICASRYVGFKPPSEPGA